MKSFKLNTHANSSWIFKWHLNIKDIEEHCSIDTAGYIYMCGLIILISFDKTMKSIVVDNICELGITKNAAMHCIR